MGGHKLCVFEQIEMIGNAGGAHVEALADLADSEIPILEHFEDATAGGIAESFEEKVQWLYN